MALNIWVAQLLISPRTAAKIEGRHQLTPDEVRTAVVCVEGLDFDWHRDAERGERALVAVTIRGRPVRLVLYDAAHPVGDVWHLGSAYYMDT